MKSFPKYYDLIKHKNKHERKLSQKFKQSYEILPLKSKFYYNPSIEVIEVENEDESMRYNQVIAKVNNSNSNSNSNSNNSSNNNSNLKINTLEIEELN